MHKMVFQNFKGMIPRQDNHYLNNGYSDLALDVNLWHGTLKPFREKVLCKTITEAVHSVHHDDCCWKIYDQCTDFVRLNTPCNRQVVTGLFPYPAVACSDECEPKWIRLGVPCPGDGPEADYQGALKPLTPYTPNFIDSVDYELESRAYVYTYVNSCGDEGPPSYPSEMIDADDSGVTIVTGFNRPSDEYDVTHFRLYRTATAFDDRNNSIDNYVIESKEEMSGYFLVGEFPITQQVVTDDLSVAELGYELDTHFFTEPPKDLQGLVKVGGNGLAGFVGNKVRFSVPNFPHAWQEEDEITLPEPVRALVEYNENVIVLTCGNVYRISPKQDCKGSGCRQVAHTLENYPLISCCHGYTHTPKGVVFVSAEGLISTDGTNAVNLTTELFAPDDWKALHPDQMSVAYYRDHIYFFSDVAGFCLQFPISQSRWEHSTLVALSDRPRWAFSHNEELYFVEKDGVYRWNAGDTLRAYFYRTKKEIAPTQLNFAGAKISRYNIGDLNVKLYGDDILVSSFDVQRAGKYRLPAGRRDVEFFMEFHGTAEVYLAEISTSYRDLSVI